MNEEFFKNRARAVRDIADKADPFTRKRLLELADKYENRPRPRQTPLPSISAIQKSRKTGDDGNPG